MTSLPIGFNWEKSPHNTTFRPPNGKLMASGLYWAIKCLRYLSNFKKSLMSNIDISSKKSSLAYFQFILLFRKTFLNFPLNPASEWIVSPCTCAAAVFVVAETMKTESSNGCPIILQKFLQKERVAFKTKLFPLPPDPVKCIIKLACPPLSWSISVACFFSSGDPNCVSVGSFKNVSINEEQIMLNAAACFGSSPKWRIQLSIEKETELKLKSTLSELLDQSKLSCSIYLFKSRITLMMSCGRLFCRMRSWEVVVASSGTSPSFSRKTDLFSVTGFAITWFSCIFVLSPPTEISLWIEECNKLSWIPISSIIKSTSTSLNWCIRFGSVSSCSSWSSESFKWCSINDISVVLTTSSLIAEIFLLFSTSWMFCINRVASQYKTPFSCACRK